MLVWFRLGILDYILSLFSVVYRTVSLAIFFWHIRDGGMWELGDWEVVCFRLVSLFLSVCWLEKLMLNHGALVVVLD